MFIKTVFSVLALLVLACSALSKSTVVVTTDKPALRGTPSANGKVVEKLKDGLELEIYKTQGKWYLVQSPNYAGWINDDDVRLSPPDAVTGSGNITMGAPQPLPPGPNYQVLLKTPPVKPAVTSASPAKTDDHTYYKGPKGGCYYINGSGKKTYVDHAYCN